VGNFGLDKSSTHNYLQLGLMKEKADPEINLLLVDDEEEFVVAITERLRKRGFTVDYALTGMEALNRLKQNGSIDVIILDISLPDSDGIDILKKIKTKHPLIEVIILSGYATINSAVESLKLDAFDFLAKPFDLSDLVSKAKQAVIKKREREAKILDVKMKPYISEQERNELISRILGE
jgi:DNA-binding NtrC family response regulator